MKKITRKDLAADAHVRYAYQYRPERWKHHPDIVLEAARVVRRLQGQRNPDRVDEITGNSLWTTQSCDSCKESKDELVSIQSHSDTEYGPCHYCKVCLAKALEVILT